MFIFVSFFDIFYYFSGLRLRNEHQHQVHRRGGVFERDSPRQRNPTNLSET